MGFYSLGLGVALAAWMLWYLLPMVLRRAWPPGVKERLGAVPERLRPTVSGKRVAWVHAVSVGEALAASRLVGELGEALGPEWVVVVSTTTATGQKLAQERFGAERVFYMPLDFAFVWRKYLRALQPEVIVLMESEVWPRMMYECRRRDVPVIVVNARVSDRSFGRSKKVRWIWSRVLRQATLWLAQTEEDARRLVEMGARSEAVRVGGNLKYDVRAAKESRVAALVKRYAAGRPIIVAGSTVVDDRTYEDELTTIAWRDVSRQERNAVLVIAPRHPERFEDTFNRAHEYRALNASSLKLGVRTEEAFTKTGLGGDGLPVELIVLDTIGDLAAVYGIADVAFVGGSLVKRGGHNPLEPAQFGVPVVMGPSYENFRDIVGRMIAADAITIVQDEAELAAAFEKLLTDTEYARAMGERGRRVFEQQQGATARAVEAVREMVQR